MIRIAIAEDQPACRQLLQDYLVRFGEERKIEIGVTVFSDGITLVQNYCPVWDVILMDIEMPMMDGMTAAQRIRKKDSDVIIIFITNMAKYAIKGYEVKALDFVLKPINYFAFSMKMDKVVSALNCRMHGSILVSSEGVIVRLSTREITYIEAIHHRLEIHTESKVYATSGTLAKMEDYLKGMCFAKCNKGYLVNLHHVKRIFPDAVLVGNEKLQIARRRRGEFLAAVTDYYGGGGI